MNNKEFIAELADKLGYSAKDTTDLVNSTISIIVDYLQNEESVSIQNFGIFEVKKKMERVSINPITKQRFLVPPKLALAFKPSMKLKGKIKD